MNNNKVSVAMITYNGINHIGAQLDSIFNQTVTPDEIIISDDGSTDGTIELIQEIIEQKSKFNISLRIDNPIHGISSNISWAIQHTTGDIIFISGQDDVWVEKKIENTLKVYEDNPDAKMVITNAKLIDGNGNNRPGDFCKDFIDSLCIEKGKSVKVDRSANIERVISGPLVSGPVLSYRSELNSLILPLPKNVLEDQWMEFIGLAEDSLYFLNDSLTMYRIHDSATHTEKVPLFRRIKKNVSRIRNAYTHPFYYTNLGKAMMEYFIHYEGSFCRREEAINTVQRLLDIGENEVKFMKMSRIAGVIGLRKYYRIDSRYRRCGRSSHVVSLLYIALYSKNKRCKDIDLIF